jgi:NitT/TauT family transport system substrate-binding protein
MAMSRRCLAAAVALFAFGCANPSLQPGAVRSEKAVQAAIAACEQKYADRGLSSMAQVAQCERALALPQQESMMPVETFRRQARNAEFDASEFSLSTFMMTIAGWRDPVRDPKAGIAALRKRDPLLNDQIELDRPQHVLDRALLTATIKAKCLGTIDPGRMSRALAINAEAFQITNPPAAGAIYTTKFLPPQAERMP